MAYGEPERDAYGNPISIPPHNQIFINKDHLPMPRRTKICVDDTLQLTDDPDSDSTCISVLGSPGKAINVVDTIDELRSWTGVFLHTDDFVLFRTRGYKAVNDGGDAWYMFQRGFLDTADDGVLTFEIASLIGVGRARYLNGGNDSMFLASRCGTAKASGSRVSFDPSGVVPWGSELERVTGLLSDAGYSGIAFDPSATYSSLGEHVAQRAEGRGFILDGQNCLLRCASSTLPSGSQIRAWARARGDNGTSDPAVFFTLGYVANGTNTAGRFWTQSFAGGDKVMTSVSSLGAHGTVPALQVGDGVLVRIGAVRSDAAGWSHAQYFAHVDAINGSNVTLDVPIIALPPFDAGINTLRIQTKHDMIAIDPNGYQDNLVIKNFNLDRVSFSTVYDRGTVFDNHYVNATFGLNATGSFDMDINITCRHCFNASGDNTGQLVTLNGCHATHASRITCDFLDGVSAWGEELATEGTVIELMDLTWDASSKSNNSIFAVGQSPMSTELITIGHLVLRQGKDQMNIVPNVHIEQLDVFSGNQVAGGGVSNPDNVWIGVDLDKIERITYCADGESAPRSYSGRDTRQFIFPYPTTGNSTKLFTSPIAGLVRRFRVFPTGDITHLSAMLVRSSNVGSGPDFKSIITNGTSKWYEINYGQQLGLTYPDFWGLGKIIVALTSDNSGTPPPAGAQLALEIEYFKADVKYYDQTGTAEVEGDASSPLQLTGDGAPSTNSNFIGQEYFDVTNQSWYRSVTTGTAGSDWKKLTP